MPAASQICIARTAGVTQELAQKHISQMSSANLLRRGANYGQQHASAAAIAHRVSHHLRQLVRLPCDTHRCSESGSVPLTLAKVMGGSPAVCTVDWQAAVRTCRTVSSKMAASSQPCQTDLLASPDTDHQQAHKLTECLSSMSGWLESGK